MNRRAIVKGALGVVAGLTLTPFARYGFSQESPAIVPVRDGFVMLTGAGGNILVRPASAHSRSRAMPGLRSMCGAGRYSGAGSGAGCGGGSWRDEPEARRASEGVEGLRRELRQVPAPPPRGGAELDEWPLLVHHHLVLEQLPEVRLQGVEEPRVVGGAHFFGVWILLVFLLSSNTKNLPTIIVR